MKKITILLCGLILAIAIMTYLYFSKLNTDNQAKDLALQSATNNAALIFSFQNDKSFYQIIEGQNLLQQVIGKEKSVLLSQFKNALINNAKLNNFIKEQPIYISVLPDTLQQLNFLITVQINKENNAASFYKQFKSKLRKEPNESHIYTLKLNDSLGIYLKINEQVLTASTSLKLVKDAAIRLNDNPFTEYIKENSLFNKNVLANLYINFNQAPLLLKNILASNLTGELSILNHQNSFAAFNYNFSKERILFNGNTEFKSEDNYLKTFENTAPQSITINALLPDNTGNYALFAFDTYPNWQKKLAVWQKKHTETERIHALITEVKDQYRVDLDKIFPVYTKNQFVTFQLNTGEKLGAIALSNGEKVKQLLLDLSNEYTDEIRVLKTAGILNAYFGDPLKKFTRPSYIIVDNYLIIANNPSTLTSFLNSYRNNKLLIQSSEYLNTLNQLANKSTITYYINHKNSIDIFRNTILLPFYKQIRKEDGLRQFNSFYYQMCADKNKFITNILLNQYISIEVPNSSANFNSQP
ncbi:hypothetical protein [Pedobacter sp. MW01-1-1]|uniref:hypothetical protein n=1 Tax=Pedobacter sp. MW01-1-1 TaxID=3383027 RepID=UPI003FEEDC97